MPIVAIVVGGLGVGAAKTVDAILRLPAAVTLAFTPYGSDPAKLVERARAQHHEILLQIPMEPYDYPDNDPGPQTLLTTLAPEQNHRPPVLAPQPVPGLCRNRQFHGRPLCRDRYRDGADRERGRQARPRLFRRRIGARSVAPSLAAAQAVPFARADVTIDAVPTSAKSTALWPNSRDWRKNAG